MTATNETTIAEIPVREGEVIRVTRCENNRGRSVRLRTFFLSESGDWRPGRHGLDISKDIAAPLVGAILNAATQGRS